MGTPQEIEREFSAAGWELDGSFSDHLVIGYCDDGGISLLAYKECWETDDDLFEIIDRGGMVTYWTSGVPTPQQAKKLLVKYGCQPS